jgi:hypothetical protein
MLKPNEVAHLAGRVEAANSASMYNRPPFSTMQLSGKENDHVA